MPWRSEGWQGEQAGRFPGEAGAGLPTSWERKGPFSVAPKLSKGRGSEAPGRAPSVWPQSCQRAEGQRLQEGPFSVAPKLSKGRGSKAPVEACSGDSELTQETGAPCWRDPGTALWKRGHVHGAKLNTLLL